MRRQRKHHFRVYNRKSRESESASEADFLVLIFVGNHCPRVGFRSGASRSRYGYYRKSFLHQVSFAASSIYIIPIITVVYRHYGNGLCRVDRTSSTQSDDKVASKLAADGGGFHYMSLHGVRKYLIVNHCAHAIFGKKSFYFIQIAIFPHRCSGRNNNHGFLTR